MAYRRDKHRSISELSNAVKVLLSTRRGSLSVFSAYSCIVVLLTWPDLTRIAVNIPELDQAIPGSLRSNFFPLALTESSTFLAIVLLSSSHYSAVGSTLGASNLLRLKQETLEAINEAMRRDQNLISDALIGTVAKMAAYEAMYGDPQTYLAHMAGLKRMIELRGGLSGLGLGGLLRRLILWIDTNAAFLIRVPLQFPGEVFAELQATIEPNPEHFIGRSN